MNLKPFHSSTLTALSIAITVALFLAACHGTGNPRDNPSDSIGEAVDFRRVPPGVESATIQPLGRDSDRGNALLEVAFDKADKRIAKSVSIFPEGREVVLRDDGRNGDAKAGDGLFSAVVDFDFEELGKQAAAAANRVESAKPRAIFQGREIIGIEDVAMTRERLKRFSAMRDFTRLINEKIKISLFDIPIDPGDIDPALSLMITDPAVVQDPTRTMDPCGTGNPNGAWTFKHLVSEMVSGTGVDPADFVEQWLRLWDSNQAVASGFMAAPRHAMITKFLDVWPRKNGKLDLDQSPFRLSAIVNRIDLAQNTIYGGGSAGEGRFIFGVRDRTQGGCQLMPFSVIFEYGIPESGCHDVKDWARQWIHLSSLPAGSDQYRTALEAITNQFTKANAAPNKPNGSALNQLRTNENALVANKLWELREFKLSASTHLLVEDTTKQTPDETLNNSAAVAQWVNAHASAIVQDKHIVPNRFPGSSPFMAATSRATLANQLQTHFRAPGILNNNARFHFSLNTCSGCHIRETNTNANPPFANNAFLHVDPVPMPAKLSRFLTGATPSTGDSPDPFMVPDPVGPPSPHAFNDLEMRRQKLANFANSLCLRQILVPPLRLIDVLPRIDPEGPLQPIRDIRVDGINIPNRMTH